MIKDSRKRLYTRLPAQENAARTYGSSAEIDREAVKQFRNCLPFMWLDRNQIPEFAVDFQIEEVSEGEPTGRRFATQLKGTAPDNKTLKRQLEVKL